MTLELIKVFTEGVSLDSKQPSDVDLSLKRISSEHAAQFWIFVDAFHELHLMVAAVDLGSDGFRDGCPERPQRTARKLELNLSDL